jgi:hypothetical protein
MPPNELDEIHHGSGCMPLGGSAEGMAPDFRQLEPIDELQGQVDKWVV